MQGSIAALRIVDILRPKPEGYPVNHHVLPAASEPAPDYEAMRRLVTSPVIHRSQDSDQSAADGGASV
jgi:hypothetical protein